MFFLIVVKKGFLHSSKIKMAKVQQSMCLNKDCSYCKLVNDESTYYFNNSQLYMSGEELYTWKYYDTSLEEFIKMFHSDNCENLISECNNICDKFMCEISNNNVQDTTCTDLDKLFGYGCYLRQFIYNIFQMKYSNIIDSIIESGSVRTFYKYIYYASSYNYTIIHNLYQKNRYDILYASNDVEYKSIGFYNIIRNEIYFIIRSFLKANRTISTELKEHLINTFGEEFIVGMFANLSVEEIERNLREKFPSPRLCLDNLPTSIQNLTFSENNNTSLILNNIEKPLDMIYVHPPYIVKDKTIENINDFIDNGNCFKYLDNFASTSNAKKIIANIYNNSKTQKLQNMKMFYPELFSSVQKKITERYIY